jgi:L,D-transpeptidase YbiS
MAGMTRRKVGFALAAPAIVFLAVIRPGLGYQWSDPDPSADSLALEAERKLTSPLSRPPADSGKRTVGSPLKPARPRGPYIVIDTHTNRLYLRTADSVLFSALCSTGTGAELIDTGEGRYWRFDTPKGFYRVNSRLRNPWWRKPDWAFIEEGKTVPDDDDERFDPDAMGDYAIGFGDGYFIHGTVFERLIGVSVTHGCVRLRGSDLKRVYESIGIGTPIIIF